MILQGIINKYLRLDPSIDSLLLPLENKTLHINCSDFAAQIYAAINNGHFLFSSSEPAHCDIKISGKLVDFVSFALNKQQSALQIQGDLHAAQNLQKLLVELNIDWAQELSKITGDFIAQEALYLFKQFSGYRRDAHNSLADMITEYLQEESGLLPTAHEVTEFIQAVDALRLRVDRLEARINHADL